MRATMKKHTPERFKLVGPLRLSDPRLPDIDLLVHEPESPVALVGELKWARKTMRVREHADRDAELEKGFQQLRELRTFLRDHPQFIRNQLRSSGGDSDFELSYCLIARDHMTWIEPEDDIWLTEFDAIIWSLQNSRDLAEAIRKLRTYEWLPKEGGEFMMRFETATAGGVSIQVEVVHRPPFPNQNTREQIGRVAHPA